MSENRTVGGGFLRRHASALFPAALIVAVFVFSLSCARSAHAGDIKQMEFNSPRQAFDALVNAAGGNDTRQLLAIFGPEGRDVISSGDAVADTEARERFVRAAKHAFAFRKLDEWTFLAVVGKEGWTFPIPITRSGKSWVFLTGEGRQEIINRRIGRNELNTIRTSLAYVEAQRQYFESARSRGGVLQYAQRFMSHEGSRDGLYWPGRGDSPLGPFFARASYEGNASRQAVEKPVPYYGYYFRILKGQGSHAPGGARDYVVNGAMTGGFGLVACPAKYGVSGIMTFMVNQMGVVYEKDLGPGTREIAARIKAYDPDRTWEKVEEAPRHFPVISNSL